MPKCRVWFRCGDSVSKFVCSLCEGIVASRKDAMYSNVVSFASRSKGCPAFSMAVRSPPVPYEGGLGPLRKGKRNCLKGTLFSQTNNYRTRYNKRRTCGQHNVCYSPKKMGSVGMEICCTRDHFVSFFFFALAHSQRDAFWSTRSPYCCPVDCRCSWHVFTPMSRPPFTLSDHVSHCLTMSVMSFTLQTWLGMSTNCCTTWRQVHRCIALVDEWWTSLRLPGGDFNRMFFLFSSVSLGLVPHFSDIGPESLFPGFAPLNHDVIRDAVIYGLSTSWGLQYNVSVSPHVIIKMKPKLWHYA